MRLAVCRRWGILPRAFDALTVEEQEELLAEAVSVTTKD